MSAEPREFDEEIYDDEVEYDEEVEYEEEDGIIEEVDDDDEEIGADGK